MEQHQMNADKPATTWHGYVSELTDDQIEWIT